MIMLGTTKYTKFLDHDGAKLVFRQHALYRFGNDLLRRFFEQFFEADRLQVTDITRVMIIDLVFQLVAGHPYFGRIDHDDVIPGINMRREFRLVFTTQPSRNFARQAAQRAPAGIDQVPVMDNLCGFGRKSAHTIKSDNHPRRNRPGAEKAAILLAFGPLYKRRPGNAVIDGLQTITTGPI